MMLLYLCPPNHNHLTKNIKHKISRFDGVTDTSGRQTGLKDTDKLCDRVTAWPYDVEESQFVHFGRKKNY